jgi:hypothetical protein
MHESRPPVTTVLFSTKIWFAVPQLYVKLRMPTIATPCKPCGGSGKNGSGYCRSCNGTGATVKETRATPNRGSHGPSSKKTAAKRV